VSKRKAIARWPLCLGRILEGVNSSFSIQAPHRFHLQDLNVKLSNIQENAMKAVAQVAKVTQADPALVLTKATLRAAEFLGIKGASLGQTIGVSEATVSRINSGDRTIDPHSKEGELALLLVRLYRSLDALVGNQPGQGELWLNGFNQAFNASPKSLITQTEGLVRVVSYLDSMRAKV
jgi:hypothetical protein